MIGRLHEDLVYGRRVEVLARHIAALLPPDASVLDIGCGDGEVATEILRLRPDLSVQGIDVLKRPKAAIPVMAFDGENIPLADGAVDAAILVDVLHHTEDPAVLLAEAKRVSKAIVIKDHDRTGLLAGLTLRAMDWVGNARYGVALPYNYLRPTEWSALFRDVGLGVEVRIDKLGLYPMPASILFERSLHFVTRLAPTV